MIWLPSFEGAAYRLHNPKWAYTPASGAGAGTHGGRANRPGLNALYLSTTTETAVSEYKQLSNLLPPGTLVSYEVKAEPVIDFTKGHDANQWDALWGDFFCDWRELWFDKQIEPPSWVLGDMAIAAGAKGVLFTSRLPAGGVNMVLYTDQLQSTDIVKAYDPEFLLPKNTDSWS